MYIRINILKTDVIYLKMWCNSVVFCQRRLFLLTLYMAHRSSSCDPVLHVLMSMNSQCDNVAS